MSFEFRPLWQLTAAEKAQVALQKAQTSAVYAGLSLWPAAVTGALVRSQLLEDGVYPGAAAIFEAAAEPRSSTEARKAAADFDPSQARDPQGRWTGGGGSAPSGSEAPSMSEVGIAGPIRLAATTTTNFGYACKILNIDPIAASDALHAAKYVLRLSGSAQCTFDLKTDDISFNVEIIGNLRD